MSENKYIESEATCKRPEAGPDAQSSGLSRDEQCMARFAGLDRAYGKYEITGKKKDGVKVDGRATTIQGTLTVEMWSKHLNGEQGLGVVPIKDDGSCTWGCIDVDIYDLDINSLARRVKDLPLIVCRSKSGGAHLFLFTSEPVPAALLRKKLTDACIRLGFGNLEIFPKQSELLTARNDTGNSKADCLGDYFVLRAIFELAESKGDSQAG